MTTALSVAPDVGFAMKDCGSPVAPGVSGTGSDAPLEASTASGVGPGTVFSGSIVTFLFFSYNNILQAGPPRVKDNFQNILSRRAKGPLNRPGATDVYYPILCFQRATV